MTVSAPKTLSIFLVLIVAFGVGLLYERSQEPHLSFKHHRFSVEIADTPAARERGLSDRDSLGRSQAMVFVYNQPGMRCFWMKDMRFNIDMVWLNADKKVVAMKSDVVPATYPTNFCHNNSQYVVEFVAGTAQKLRMKQVDTVQSTAW